jgi:two-component system, OmpR family, sensor histidine kinase PhoQ
MRSVSQRLLISVTVLLLLFFGVMAEVLDARFRAVAENSLRELLDAQLRALVASAEPDTQGHIVPRLPDAESRLATPGSGLYAAARENGGSSFWRSPSATGSLQEFGPPQEPGGRDFRYLTDSRGARLAAESRGISWEENGVSRELTFTVAADLAPMTSQVNDFRRGLVKGFTTLAVSLLLALALLLRWALAPLRRLASQIQSMERGERDSLDERWPTEIEGVVANLNTLLASERTRISRYRDTMGNLAHSLKTPLAVLRSSFGAGRPGAAQVNEQVDRMTAIVEHQLRRAATSGGVSVGRRSVDVLPIVQDLRGALIKAYANKDFSLELAVPSDVQFVGDRDDLLESVGNLMDNASKWCRSRVRVTALLQTGVGAGQKLRVLVEDDGPGVPEADRDRVLQRGARADEATPGHGLGLAMVRDMAEMYGGALALGDSGLGGARVELRLPGRLR